MQFVREMQIVEHPVVAARVRPVVGLAEADPQQARLVLPQVAERDAEGQHVVAAFLPQLHDLAAQARQRSISGVLSAAGTRS